MLFRQLFDAESSTYTYLIADEDERKAVIIDPVKKNCAQYIQLLKELDLSLLAALDTHIHADHVTGIGELRRCLGCQTMMGEKSTAQGLSYRLNDEEIFCWGRLSIKALYTPGHTDNSYCFVMNDRVFTGDTLLIRGTGRSDFQCGDASVHYDSIHNKLFTLPENMLVYPGHDYKGMTVSTIGEEKRFNPRLHQKTREDYIELMRHLHLPYPKQMDVALPLNQRCGLEYVE